MKVLRKVYNGLLIIIKLVENKLYLKILLIILMTSKKELLIGRDNKKVDYNESSDTLILLHNAGFFSACSVKLHYLVKYFTIFNKLPTYVDSSYQFWWQKHPPYLFTKTFEGDVTFDFFENYVNYDFLINKNDIKLVNKYTWDAQWLNYTKNPFFKTLRPFIKKYFSPSKDILNIIKRMENKYNIDYDNTIVVFFRGNCKAYREREELSKELFLKKTQSILEKNPNSTVLLQSDEINFIGYMKDNFNNHIVFNDECRMISKQNRTVDEFYRNNKNSDNNLYSKYFLAIIIIMSKCKFVICGRGNCDVWIYIYRILYKNDKYFTQLIKNNWTN
tara:strand:+ start:1157 stop:2152 length:996 start_codon:yes stop_codon:yes gene_type:complete